MIVAREKGVDVQPLTRKNENQMRLLQANLRKHGIRWLREPNWYQAQHDMAVVDFRMVVERSVNDLSEIALEQWILESEFRANPDRIEFTFKGNKGTLRKKTKGVCPDGYFCLIDEKRKIEGTPHKARFLLEMDMDYWLDMDIFLVQ